MNGITRESIKNDLKGFIFLSLEGQTTEEKGSVFTEKVMEGPL
jgi:hypothetical protein